MSLALAALALLAGAFLPLQTLANTRLRERISSALFVALTSFLTAALLLAIIVALAPGAHLPTAADIARLPWWIWGSGLISVMGLTANIFLFPRLGAVETALWPVIGSIAGSITIDHCGWFSAPIAHLTPLRGLGVGLATLGIILAITARRTPNDSAYAGARAPWRLLGFAVGALAGAQFAISGRLGVELGSAISASFVNYAVGAGALALSVLAARAWPASPSDAPLQWRAIPAWLWIGGPIGVLYVIGLTLAQPVLGTGATMLLNLVGQIGASLAIDHVGFAGTPPSPLTRRQLGGLVLMGLGIAIIELM